MTDHDSLLAVHEADGKGNGNGKDPLALSGITALRPGANLGDVANCLQKLVRHLPAAPLERRVLRNRAINALKEARIVDASGLVDAALPAPNAATESKPFGFVDVDPWPEPVDGADLLNEVACWCGSYIYQPAANNVALALWVFATWFVDDLDYAAILALLSATKRCGKTHVLHLLRILIRRGYLTSGTGITTAVLFRLNDKHRPSLLIDEAERLSGHHADRELIGMLNSGYRRGARVQRCVARDSDFDVAEYDAYGFRALAAIGRLWDTILDRAVVVRLERRPKDVSVRRFSERVVETEGQELARKIRRWTDDNRQGIGAAAMSAPRPDWLDDRACDNWAGLFAVAALAGPEWSAKALEAAKTLSGEMDAGDHAELLVHDVWRLWKSEGWQDVVKSGDVTAKLNEIEGSPWGEFSGGKGLSTHRLAAMFKPLGVKPRHGRSSSGPVRGYWLADFDSVFRRYPPPEVLQPLQPLQGPSENDSQVTPVTDVTVQRELLDGDESDALARAAMRDGA